MNKTFVSSKKYVLLHCQTIKYKNNEKKLCINVVA